MNTAANRVAVDAFAGEFAKVKSQAERALAQLDDAQLHAIAGPDFNSVRVICKHMAGNLISRFTDFLTTDGEKPWRDRDGEFVEDAASRAVMLDEWERGWHVAASSLAALADDDLKRIVTVRGEPMSAAAAIARQLAHHAYHVGQIVLIAKSLCGERWNYLTIPRGESGAFNAAMTSAARR